VSPSTPRLAEVRRALRITPASTAAERTVDITTTGARTGLARRIEVWFYRADGRWFLTTQPARRSWYANLLANPAFTFHLKQGVREDLPATARPVPDPADRARILGAIVDDLNQPSDPGGVAPQRLEDWLAGSPLLEIVFDDPAIAEEPA
jgi:deazaflavin-dependent oxidoreductase (nitroreductase family)